MLDNTLTLKTCSKVRGNFEEIVEILGECHILDVKSGESKGLNRQLFLTIDFQLSTDFLHNHYWNCEIKVHPYIRLLVKSYIPVYIVLYPL